MPGEYPRHRPRVPGPFPLPADQDGSNRVRGRREHFQRSRSHCFEPRRPLPNSKMAGEDGNSDGSLLCWYRPACWRLRHRRWPARTQRPSATKISVEGYDLNKTTVFLGSFHPPNVRLVRAGTHRVLERSIRQRCGIGTLGNTLSPTIRADHRSAADCQSGAANTGISAGKASLSGNLDGSTVSGIDGAVADANA